MKHFLRNLTFFTALSFVVLSCNPVEEGVQPIIPASAEEEVTFVIRTGDHETTNPFKGLVTSRLAFQVTFDSTAIYQTKDPQNQADINKLFGMADCGSFHHQNSARFGWRWYNNRLELLAYSYVAGKNTSTFITAVDLKKPTVCELRLEDNKYVFKVGDKKVEQTRGCTGEGKGYQLYPYFGGDETAPHQINIKLKPLK
ncbi:hypothetical protein [Rufibacter psychrotolerans]|uniref:hypothetical protein n=1 Tax=Rufibacter psychrotolerans TaxID=2812556 RepID=UPI001967AD0F|nr:hypothetical protein [Rufibacter sp. SYSU D00308]